MHSHELVPGLDNLLSSSLARMDIALSPDGQAMLLSYIQMLAKWNRSFNLTAVRDPAQMVIRHLLDSLSVAPYIEGAHVLDVGAGAGLPGIPLAVYFPERQFVLLDSNAKKTRFMTQAVAELGLVNVAVVQARVEDFQSAEAFNTVITRAFSSIAQFVESAGRLCRPGGVLLAMKGRYTVEEFTTPLPEGVVLDQVVHLKVPGLDEERHVACIRRMRDPTRMALT